MMELLTYASLRGIKTIAESDPNSLFGKTIQELKNEHGLTTFNIDLELDMLAIDGVLKIKPDAPFSMKAKLVWKALGRLNMAYAKDQRLWSSLVFGPLGNLTEAPGQKKEEKIKWITNHLFVRTYREFSRHSIGKYWWSYEVARRQQGIPVEDALELFDYQQELRSALVDRNSTNINPKVTGAILHMVKDQKDSGQNFDRERVRRLLANLNFDLARRELEALPEPTIRSIIADKWKKI